jgi:hypothetical protein
VGIALAAPAAFGYYQTLAGREELIQQVAGVGVENQGAWGDGDDEGGAAFTEAVLFAAGATMVSLKEAAAAKVGQRAGMLGGF